MEWIKYFPISRTQRVQVNNFLSEDLKLGLGITQGSVLGPTFVIITIQIA